MLEPDEGKLSSPVLRGLGGRKTARPLDSNRDWVRVADNSGTILTGSFMITEQSESVDQVSEARMQLVRGRKLPRCALSFETHPITAVLAQKRA